MSLYDYVIVVTAFIALVGMPPLLFRSNLSPLAAWVASLACAVVCVRNIIGVFS